MREDGYIFSAPLRTTVIILQTLVKNYLQRIILCMTVNATGGVYIGQKWLQIFDTKKYRKLDGIPRICLAHDWFSFFRL